MEHIQKEEGKNRNISIFIPESMYNWLEEHKEINRSELFRGAVKTKQNKEQISPLLFLVSVMGIIFSVSLIVISMDPRTIPFLSPYIRLMLAFLGGILALITAIVYYKERKQILMRRYQQ